MKGMIYSHGGGHKCALPALLTLLLNLHLSLSFGAELSEDMQNKRSSQQFFKKDSGQSDQLTYEAFVDQYGDTLKKPLEDVLNEDYSDSEKLLSLIDMGANPEDINHYLKAAYDYYLIVALEKQKKKSPPSKNQIARSPNEQKIYLPSNRHEEQKDSDYEKPIDCSHKTNHFCSLAGNAIEDLKSEIAKIPKNSFLFHQNETINTLIERLYESLIDKDFTKEKSDALLSDMYFTLVTFIYSPDRPQYLTPFTEDDLNFFLELFKFYRNQKKSCTIIIMRSSKTNIEIKNERSQINEKIRLIKGFTKHLYNFVPEIFISSSDNNLIALLNYEKKDLTIKNIEIFRHIDDLATKNRNKYFYLNLFFEQLCFGNKNNISHIQADQYKTIAKTLAQQKYIKTAKGAHLEFLRLWKSKIAMIKNKSKLTNPQKIIEELLDDNELRSYLESNLAYDNHQTQPIGPELFNEHIRNYLFPNSYEEARQRYLDLKRKQ